MLTKATTFTPVIRLLLVMGGSVNSVFFEELIVTLG